MRFLAFALLATAEPAFAQSTNAAPDISVGEAAFDASKLAGLPDAAEQALSTTGDEFKKGDVLGYVFVASPDLKVWNVNAVPKTAPIYSLSDAARVALEGCEYAYGAPCIIFSINGHDTQKKLGGWASQPRMLFREPSAFDPSVLPFVPAAARPQTSLSPGVGAARFRGHDQRRMAVAERRNRRKSDRYRRGRLRDDLQERRLHPLRGQRPGRFRAELIAARRRKSAVPGQTQPGSRGRGKSPKSRRRGARDMTE